MHGMSLQVLSDRSRPIPPPWPYDAAALQAVESAVVHTQVARKDNPTILRPCLIRFLGDEDIDNVEALNELVLSRLPHPHILRRESRAYLAHHVIERGRLIGAFCDDRMVAFTLLSFPRDDPGNLGIDLGFDRQFRQQACHLELSGVDPNYRGFHLHITMNEIRAKFATAAGYHHLFGTVSPFNPYSLANHMSAGMMVRKLVVKYGGMDRYVIYRNALERCAYTPGALDSARHLPCTDVAGQKALLADGYWGVAVRKAAGGEWTVGYVPSQHITFAAVDDAP